MERLEIICEVPSQEQPSPDNKTLYKPCGKDYQDLCYCDEQHKCSYYREWEIQKMQKQKSYIDRVIAFWNGEDKNG